MACFAARCWHWMRWSTQVASADCVVTGAVASRAVFRSGKWWAYVWDERADPDTKIPGSVMYQECVDEEEAKEWCKRYERYWVDRYRARCAYEAGLPVSKPEWAEHFRDFAEIDAMARELNEQARRR